MARALTRSAAVAALLFTAAPARAQLVTTMVGRDGLELPCVTFGLLAPVAQTYCVKGTEKQGWVRKSELGWSGLSIAEDGHVTAVASASPAAQVGLQSGDLIVAVDGTAARPSPVESARRRLFGVRGEPVTLDLLRAGTSLERKFIRGPAPEPAGAPHSPNPLLGIHPLVNWRGDFVPCMGAGPLGPAAVAACTSQVQRRGYVKTDALGDAGLSFDEAHLDNATISAVTPGGAAAEADVRKGDIVIGVDGHPLDAATTDARALLFGRRGAIHHVVADRAGRSVAFDLTLAAPH